MCRPLPTVRRLDHGAYVITGNRATTPAKVRRPPSVITVHVDRHSVSTGAELAFSYLNIRALTYKLDDLLEVRHDLSIDVMFLIETWHDTDCVAFQRLRVDGFQVVDRPRPRKVADTLAINHGGVAAVAKPGIRLTALDLGMALELLSVHVVTGSSSCVVLLVYRTGPITSAFFAKFTDVLDRVATNVHPLYIMGDLNIRLDLSPWN